MNDARERGFKFWNWGVLGQRKMEFINSKKWGALEKNIIITLN